MLDRKQKIVVLSSAVYSTFSSSEWTEIGYITDTDSWMDGYPRLLRSLHWSDDDYKGHVFDAVAHILDKDPDNFKKLLEYQPIAGWLKQHQPGAFQELSAEAFGTEVLDVLPAQLNGFWFCRSY